LTKTSSVWKLLDRRHDHPLHASLVGHVRDDRERRIGTPPFEQVDCLVGRLRGDIRDHDVRAGLVQSECDPAADAHRAAGDDGRLPREVEELGKCGSALGDELRHLCSFLSPTASSTMCARKSGNSPMSTSYRR
jgi:hypothetical protein